MKKLAFIFAITFAMLSFTLQSEKVMPPKSIYDIEIAALNGKDTINFSAYKGKKMLLVNTASKCGFTKQYAGLQELYTKYKDKLVVIAFPCNEFAEQEPWDNYHIQEFCSNRFNISFPMTDKVKVKEGEEQSLIYQWLTHKKYNGKKDISIRWNFGKFLIDEKGKFVQYFPSDVEPMDAQITSLIEGKKKK